MDNFKKQQIIDSIMAVVRARWFFASAVFAQGLILKFFNRGTPLAATWLISAILVASFVYNFSYWLYLRRPLEKVGETGLKIIKGLQLVLDQLAISAILFFSGTVDKIIIVFYFVSLMIGIALYRKKGIIITAFTCGFFVSALIILEYYGYMNPPLDATDFDSGRGNFGITIRRLIAFNSDIAATAFFVWYLGNLFRKREKKLEERTSEAVEKTRDLTRQTKELIQTKDWLHEELNRSDKARIEQTKLKEELVLVNLDLKTKIAELQKFNEITVGREIKMVELKEKVKNLEQHVGEADGA